MAREGPAPSPGHQDLVGFAIPLQRDLQAAGFREPEHFGVVGKHLSAKSAKAERACLGYEQGLELAPETASLPFGVDEIAHLGEPGRRFTEEACARDEALGLPLPHDGDEHGIETLAARAEPHRLRNG